MIAYNYYIKFIPELKNDKKVKGNYIGTIVIQPSQENGINKQLNYSYEWVWSNNQGRDVSLYTDRKFDHTVKGQLWKFGIKDVVSFYWYSGDLILYYIPKKFFTLDLLEYWVLHTVLPIYFTIEEYYYFLHAGAVEVDGKPILFTAESFGGKSTMTDFFMKQGHQMISDDRAAIFEKNEDFIVVPSHPHHRPFRKAEDLGYYVENTLRGPRSVHAIYELEPASPKSDIKIIELLGVEKYESLRFSSEINLSFLKVQRFIFLMHLARQVPVYRVLVPRELDKLKDVYSAIIKHTKSIN